MGTQPSSAPSTPRGPEWGTGSSWTPARSVLGERWARTPALEMEGLLSSVRLSPAGGLWSVWSPGALDVLHTFLGSTLIFISSEIGSIPTRISNVIVFVKNNLIYLLRMTNDNLSPGSF